MSEHVVAVEDLPAIHKDPFDRLLVAQATVEGITLLTLDLVVARYPGPMQALTGISRGFARARPSPRPAYDRRLIAACLPACASCSADLVSWPRPPARQLVGESVSMVDVPQRLNDRPRIHFDGARYLVAVHEFHGNDSMFPSKMIPTTSAFLLMTGLPELPPMISGVETV